MSSTITTSLVELRETSWQQPTRPTQTPTEPVSADLGQNEALQDPNSYQSLEPADRGAAAWRLLGAAFVFEALLWGRLSQ